MSTREEQTQLLDQLQTEINRVLAQTGRVFAAATKGGSKSASIAQAARLKHELPGSIGRFQDALDQLEDELRLAKVVMRRDLAVLREQSGQAVQKPSESKVESQTAEVPEAADQETKRQADVATDVAKDEDVLMEDPESTAPEQPDVASQPQPEDSKVAQVTAPTETTTDVDDKPTTQAVVEDEPQESDAKPSDSSLHLDTQNETRTPQEDEQEANEDEKPPDTGTFSNNADLDSLFNDPVSADTGERAEFDLPADSTNEFDFGSFSAGMDNTASGNDDLNHLLPGLSEYANTQPVSNPSADMDDFDALFATSAPAGNEGQGDENGEQQGSGEHRDSTFDDLMDFADFTGGGGEGGSNSNDFEFSFD